MSQNLESCYRILLVHDAEIDDICALVNYPKIDLELICSDVNKFTGVAFEGKSRLYKSLTKRELSSIPVLLTDGSGESSRATSATVSSEDTFTKLIYEFFMKFDESCSLGQLSANSAANKIFVILTGQCAPIFGILYSLLSAAKIRPESFEIIWINGRHNGLGCAKYLRNLAKFNPVLREFNAYSSMGEGIAEFFPCDLKPDLNPKPVKLLSTSYEFSQKIKPTCEAADYARKFNYSLIAETPYKIRNLAGKYPALGEIADKVEQLVKKGDNLGLKPKRCKKLAELFAIVTETLHNANDMAKLSYFAPKVAILQNNLIQFPLHDLAAVLILGEITGVGTGLLKPCDSYAYSAGFFVEVSPLQQKTNLLPILHYISPNPEKTRQYLEKMMFLLLE